MTVSIIETHADKYPRWSQKTDIGGARYTLDFDWCERQSAWLMSIADASGNMLLAGVRLVADIDLLAKYKATVSGLPQGCLCVIDKSDDMTTAELTRDNFGTRFLLAYGEV